MTFKEFADKGLWCNDCPIKKASLCSYGSTGGFDDPPCSFADLDQDMDEWIKEKNEQIRQYEERESKRLQKEREEQRKRAEINAKKRERQKAMESYCHKELTAYKETQEALNAINARIENAETKADIINYANELFGYTDMVVVPEKLYKAKDECEKLFNEAEGLYKAKRKEFNRQYNGGK